MHGCPPLTRGARGIAPPLEESVERRAVVAVHGGATRTERLGGHPHLALAGRTRVPDPWRELAFGGIDAAPSPMHLLDLRPQRHAGVRWRRGLREAAASDHEEQADARAAPAR